jgi:hypothetical protein
MRRRSVLAIGGLVTQWRLAWVVLALPGLLLIVQTFAQSLRLSRTEIRITGLWPRKPHSAMSRRFGTLR